MAIKISSSIVINDSREVTLGGFNSDPGGVSAGAIHFNRGLGVVRGWNGTNWTNLTQGAATTELRSWGYDANGRLGVNTNSVHRSSPVSVFGNFTDWTTVDSGNQHVIAIRNGIAFSWGDNTGGKLGFNNTASRSSPTSVVGGFTDWVQVSGGKFHSTGVRANGTAWGWGANYTGQLGVGDTVGRSSPTSVVGGFTDWVQISAGNEFTMAIRNNGTAWGWGLNTQGQLGFVGSTLVNSPVSVVGGFTDWVQISTGSAHTLALRGNGSAWAWGANSRGQLGNNSTVSRSSPVSVVGITDWILVNAHGGAGSPEGTGGYHNAGIRSNGTAWCWGHNDNGTLGNNDTLGDRSSPVSVVGGFADWAQISAGNNHTVGVRLNGTAWCWGRNGRGQLGNNDAPNNRSSPVSVVGGYTDWVTISAGGAGSSGGHTFAIRATTQ